MSDSFWPCGLEPTRFLCPWDFPGKNAGVSGHFLPQGIFLTQELDPCLLLGRWVLYRWATWGDQINYSVQFSRSGVSDSLWPRESQHARPPCPSPPPGVHSNSCPVSGWCHPATVPLSVSYHFTFSYCSWGSQGKNTEVVCHSLLQWTTFCQTSPPWPVRLGWPYRAWLSSINYT